MASSQLEFAGLLTLLVKYVGSESMPVLSKPETQLSLHKHGATKEVQECQKAAGYNTSSWQAKGNQPGNAISH